MLINFLLQIPLCQGQTKMHESVLDVSCTLGLIIDNPRYRACYFSHGPVWFARGEGSFDL